MSSDPGAVTSRLFDVRGSRAVVTGAASGLGLAIAEVLADCGARVTLADIDDERLGAAAAALAARGGDVRTTVADVTDAELQMYKTRARADLLRGLADNQGLANALAEYQTRYGDWRQLFLQLDRVDKVTKADIRRVANQIFIASNRTSAEIDTEAPAAAAKSNGGAE